MSKGNKEQDFTLPGFALVDDTGSTKAIARPIALVEDPARPGETGILFSGDAESAEAKQYLIDGMRSTLPPGDLQTVNTTDSSAPSLRARSRSRTFGISKWDRSGWQPEGQWGKNISTPDKQKMN